MIPENSSPVILPVRLEPRLAEELDAVRQGRNMSRNAFVIEAVKAALRDPEDLRLRIAELTLREFLVFVDAAEEGGAFDSKTAKVLGNAIGGARAELIAKLGENKLGGSPRTWPPEGPHGLALARTEPLVEFVDGFRRLCSQQPGLDSRRGGAVPKEQKPVKKVKPNKS